MRRKRVAVVFNTYTQFQTILPGLVELNSRNLQVDLFLPRDSGTTEQLEKISLAVTRDGFQTISHCLENQLSYDVLIEPYGLSDLPSMRGLNFTYRVRFPYALISAKPNKAYIPEVNIIYDAILAFMEYEREILSVYAHTHLITPMRKPIIRQLSTGQSTKLKLLFTPTFEEFKISDLSPLRDALIKLKNEYEITVKLHEATEYRQTEVEFRNMLENVADHCLYHDADLYKLLSETDVVLSGLSGAILDAIFSKVPVAVLAPDIDRYRLSMPGYHRQLVNSGVLALAQNPDEIQEALNKAFEVGELQTELSDQLFTDNKLDFEEFSDVICMYASKNIENDYYTQMNRYYKSLRAKEAIEMKNSISWRITAPVRLAAKFLGFRGK